MTREDRAKQFAPFDAMKGLQSALADREEKHSRIERHDISDEQMADNSAVFAGLRKGDTVRIECYLAFHNTEIFGTVTKVDTVFRYLLIGSQKFCFEDIYAIEKTDLP